MAIRYAETWNVPKRPAPPAPIAHAREVFDAAACARVLEIGEDCPWVTASPSYDAGSLNALASRTGKARWIPKTEASAWIYDRMVTVIDAANEGIFHLPLREIETLQLSRYSPGDRFDTHADFGLLHATRLLSASVQLADGASYDGGDLEFLSAAYARTDGGHEVATWDGVLGAAARDQGTAVLFPAWVPHRVTQVQRGDRWSLVAWVRGDPFT